MQELVTPSQRIQIIRSLYETNTGKFEAGKRTRNSLLLFNIYVMRKILDYWNETTRTIQGREIWRQAVDGTI